MARVRGYHSRSHTQSEMTTLGSGITTHTHTHTHGPSPTPLHALPITHIRYAHMPPLLTVRGDGALAAAGGQVGAGGTRAGHVGLKGRCGRAARQRSQSDDSWAQARAAATAVPTPPPMAPSCVAYSRQPARAMRHPACDSVSPRARDAAPPLPRFPHPQLAANSASLPAPPQRHPSPTSLLPVSHPSGCPTYSHRHPP